MALNDFDYIKRKVRKITGRPSTNQLSDLALIDYINAFLVYDLPLHTRFFYNRKKYSFQLTPKESVYSIDSIKNEYTNFEPPVYIDGFEVAYYQDEQAFYRSFPRLKYSTTLATGTAAIGAGPYSGTLNYTPIEPLSLVISTVDTAGNSLLAIDDGSGGFVDEDNVAIAGATVDYETGAIAGITFTAIVNVGETIFMASNRYVTGKPYAMLYSNNEFRFYPHPDRAYTVEMIAYPNPSASVSGGGASFPELKQWADVITMGTALKIFSDNLDLEAYSKVNVLFNEAVTLAKRRTLKQLSTQRISTIYSTNGSSRGFFGFPNGG